MRRDFSWRHVLMHLAVLVAIELLIALVKLAFGCLCCSPLSHTSFAKALPSNRMQGPQLFSRRRGQLARALAGRRSWTSTRSIAAVGSRDMKSEFSESRYENAFCLELYRRYGAVIIGLPYITDRQEERGLGWDVMYRIQVGLRAKALFVQYKVAELVEYRSRDNGCSDLYSGRFYRFGLHRDRRALRSGIGPVHRQHNNLVALANRGYQAVYAAPRFFLSGDLVRKAASGRISEESFFGDPAVVGPIRDRDPHHISYSTDGVAWARHSEPVPLGRPMTWEHVLQETEALDFDEEQLRDLSSVLRDVVDQEAEEGWSRRERIEPPYGESTFAFIRDVADVAAQDFGAVVALVPTAPLRTYVP